MSTNPTIETDHVVVDLGGSAPARFHHLWLRDNCPEQQHPQTRHRVEESSTLDDAAPNCAQIAGEQLILLWPDEHECSFDLDWLRRHDYSTPKPPAEHQTLWRADDVAVLPRASWPQVLADPDVRASFVEGVRRYGVALLHDVPTTPGKVEQVGRELARCAPPVGARSSTFNR